MPADQAAAPPAATVPSAPASTAGAAPRPAALAVLLVASTLTVLAGAVLTPVLEVMRGELGVDGTRAGLLVTAHGLAIAVVSPLVGRLVDRHGSRPVLAGGLLLYGLAGGCGALLSDYSALLASRFVFGLGAAAVFSSSTVALLTLATGPARDRVMGWRSTAISAGGVLWPLLGGALGGLSWHAPFAVYAVGVPLGLLAWRLLPAAPAASGAAPGGVLTLLRRPVLLGCYGVVAAGTVLLYVLVIFLPRRLAENGVTAPFQVSLHLMCVALVMSLVGLAYARLRARLGHRALVRSAVACWAAAFAVLALDGPPSLLVLAPALFGLGQGLSVPALTVLIAEHAPPGHRGRAASLAGTATFAGQFLSPLAFGPLVSATSTATGFLAAAVLAGAVLALLFLPWARGTAGPEGG